MESTDYNDLDEVPEEVESATAAAARNAAHLARVLQQSHYPLRMTWHERSPYA